jgi:acyl-coenzyme A synthetase/AMP-(fatty) acid ligase/thioesterase domain-containing protein/acyl carrier protein
MSEGGDRGRIVLADGGREWTAGELSGRIEAWAEALRHRAPVAGVVALLLPHSAEAVAALVGCLLARRTFVFLDPAASDAVHRSQLDHAAAQLLVVTADTSTQASRAGWTGPLLSPEDVAGELRGRPCEEVFDSSAPVCLQFTSGSTGTPKAVAWSGSTLARAAINMNAMFCWGTSDRHALLVPLCVASAPAQVCGALAAGAQLCLLESRAHALSAVARFLADAKITTWQTVPSYFRAVAGEVERTGFGSGLRAIKLGGEPATAADAGMFDRLASPTAILFNGLGITEAGFNVCWHAHRPGEIVNGPRLPLGLPPPGIELAVESAPGVAAPLGQAGELVVFCPDLAPGYWRNPAATAASYGEVAGRRFLRTGDVVRRAADGVLEHLGRLDGVKKIRGHRADPAELTAALLSLEGVADAVVSTGSDGRLVAHVEMRPGVSLVEADVRQRLASMIPSAQQPAALIPVKAIPRLASGKPDRPRLSGAEDSRVDQTPVEDALERTLHALFSRVLSKNAFATTESFFDLGGDSLAAARLFADLHRVLGFDLPLVELARHPSVAALAGRLRQRGWELSSHPLVLLSPSASAAARPLFMWPGAGSDALSLAPLAASLGPDVALYAIQHRGADGCRVYDLTVEDIAKRSLALIRRVQPVGPYALCGTSFGGLVALEVAQRLRAAQDEVEFLALLDTYSPGYLEGRPGLRWTARVRFLLRSLRPLDAKESRDLPTLWRGVLEHLHRGLIRRAVRRPRPTKPPWPSPLRFTYLQEACFQASRSYVPAPYDGVVHFYRVQNQLPADLYLNDEALGWRRWLVGSLHLATVGGHHGEHLRNPHVHELAAGLLKQWAAAIGRSSPFRGPGSAA